MPRLFVALDPPEAVRSTLAAFRVDVPGARRTAAEKMHLTLAFLGEVAVQHVDGIAAALAGVGAAPAEVVLDGLGAFPNERAARVLVARVTVSPALVALHAGITRALAGVGFAPETRPFRPHLTLARLRAATPQANRADVRAFLAQPLPPLAFRAEAFHLYESLLRPEGPHYVRLRPYPLT